MSSIVYERTDESVESGNSCGFDEYLDSPHQVYLTTWETMYNHLQEELGDIQSFPFCEQKSLSFLQSMNRTLCDFYLK